jgi:pimeloyl-ACP methyl ester carboxylesterase
MSRSPRLVGVLLVVLVVAAFACSGDDKSAKPGVSTNTSSRPLPPRVQVRERPQGVSLSDPTFDALPGARADFGRLGGAVYEAEVPTRWNGRLVLFMHGFEELGPEAHVTAPDIRRYLVDRGFAWGASSFSSTSMIPGRSTDETAALWDYFARKYGRPARTYVIGLSMGGLASSIAAERYANRFDGALGLCGSASLTPAAEAEGNFFVAGAYVAGVTQSEFDASTDLGGLISDRIRPALRDPQARARFENIMIDLTGGPRAFDREGFRAEEETNWRRAGWLVGLGLAPNADTVYRLGPLSNVTNEAFNRGAIRLRTNERLLRGFLEGNEITGELRIPLLALHTTGDGQVPIDQAQILQRRVDAAGRSDLLVERVIPDPGHCGFTNQEWEAGLEALVAWVERGKRPQGTDVMVDDLRKLDRTFELSPRPGTPGADVVTGAHDRVVLRGNLTVDGKPFDARFLGAVVRRQGLITPCQYTLPPVVQGRYQIVVLADTESRGCGVPGSEILLWTFRDRILYSRSGVDWPGNGGSTSFNGSFSTSAPNGDVPPMAQFNGELLGRDGGKLPPGTRVDAYVGDTRCGVASTRHGGSFSGYILNVVGPESIAGCTRGATLTFRIDGKPAIDAGVVNTPPGRQGSLDLTLR